MSDNSNISISEPFTLTSDYDICKECSDQELKLKLFRLIASRQCGSTQELVTEAEIIFKWLKKGDEQPKSDTSGLG